MLVFFLNGKPLCFAVLGFVSFGKDLGFGNGLLYPLIFGKSPCKLRALPGYANWNVGHNGWESVVLSRSW